MAAARGQGEEGSGELLFPGGRVSLWEDEDSPEDGWWRRQRNSMKWICCYGTVVLKKVKMAYVLCFYYN